MVSLKEDRLASANANSRSDNPCVRCVNKMSREGIMDESGGCHMLVDDKLRRGMEEEGIKYTKCAYCLKSGEKCFELPVTFEPERQALEDAVLDVLAPVDPLDPAQLAQANATVMSQANTIIQFLQAENKIPYDDHLYAHSGAMGKIAETGVVFEKRARSKADIAKKEEKKRKALEKDSDEDEAAMTPSKKKKYGVKGVRVTEAEQRRRVNAAKAADAIRRVSEEHDKADNIRNKASRDRTSAEKRWLTGYNKKHPNGRSAVANSPTEDLDV